MYACLYRVTAQVSALQKQRDELVSSRAAQAAEMSAKISALHAEKEELIKGRSDRETELVNRISALEAERSEMAATQAAELADMSGKVAALQSQVLSAILFRPLSFVMCDMHQRGHASGSLRHT